MGAMCSPQRVNRWRTPSAFSMRTSSCAPVDVAIARGEYRARGMRAPAFQTADGASVRACGSMSAASGPRAEAGQRCGQLGERWELRLGVELLRPVVEDRLGLRDVRIGNAAVDRTDGRAGFLLVEADALGAEDRVDDEDVLALADGAVRA